VPTLNPLKPIKLKRAKKREREHKVLLGLIELHIRTGEPIGSKTLMAHGFSDLSSATIRNYFAKLETAGYLMQKHSSGGRIPTNLAFREYANECIDCDEKIDDKIKKQLEALSIGDTKEVATFLQKSADLFSDVLNCAAFVSAPRFDHDFVSDLKLVNIDDTRCLCVIITDFGLVQTHILHTDTKPGLFSLKRIESYFHYRLTKQDKPEDLTDDETLIARELYNEVMVRYLISYSNFSQEDIYHSGFSHLLSYPEFNNANSLANGLALFENPVALRSLLHECLHCNELTFWIDDDLDKIIRPDTLCSVVCIPYYINNIAAGAIGIVGPTRMPYTQVFSVARTFSQHISDALTKSLYKFKITFRQPHSTTLYLENEESHLIDIRDPILLENKSV